MYGSISTAQTETGTVVPGTCLIFFFCKTLCLNLFLCFSKIPKRSSYADVHELEQEAVQNLLALTPLRQHSGGFCAGVRGRRARVQVRINTAIYHAVSQKSPLCCVANNDDSLDFTNMRIPCSDLKHQVVVDIACLRKCRYVFFLMMGSIVNVDISLIMTQHSTYKNKPPASFLVFKIHNTQVSPGSNDT